MAYNRSSHVLDCIELNETELSTRLCCSPVEVSSITRCFDCELPAAELHQMILV